MDAITTPQLPPPSGHLLHNLLLFGRLLRGLGLDINPGRMMDLAQALGYIEIGRKSDFYHAARSLLVHRQQDLTLFDQAFAMFWRKPADQWAVLDSGTLLQRRASRPTVVPPPLREPNASSHTSNLQSPISNPQSPILEVTRTYSAREVLRQKDFADLSGEEVEAVRDLMAALALELGQRRTRRLRAGQGTRLDLRRTLRHNLRYGGEVLQFAHREPKFKPRPLVILADISGSMERYTRLLLHFIYAVVGAGRGPGTDRRPVEVFVFGTRLTRISRPLRNREVDRALHEVSLAVPDWAGGTRIGEALKAFNFDWGRRVLGGGAVVLLISDGWDRGDPDLLRAEIARLQRSCHRLIWLNPLLGSPEYEPLTRGMQAALPYIDDFLPVHNLASLEDLAAHLARLDQRRRG